MEIFITLTKYSTQWRREEGKSLLMVYNLASILTPSYNTVQCIYEEYYLPVNVHMYSI